jgi:hypothetical protein
VGTPPRNGETAVPDSRVKKAMNGAEGIRTPGLLHAMQALSQLSYGPKSGQFSRWRAKSSAQFTPTRWLLRVGPSRGWMAARPEN